MIPPARPFITLGQAVHLNGALARDVPAPEADPRPCRGCGGIVFRKGFAYCDRCQRTQCRTCHGPDGTHRPGCAARPTRGCRGCGVPMSWAGGRKYCARCRALTCPECRIAGGRHAARCRYAQRRHRGDPRRPGVYRGLVTNEDLVRCFVEMRGPAVRLARGIVGDAWAEDIVQETFVYLLDRRDELKAVPTLGYVLTATRHVAFAWKRRVVHAMAVSVATASLPEFEALMYALEHGRARTPAVTLPESVA